MAYLEYPKHVYRKDRTSVVVKDSAEEAAAAADGYSALPAAPPDTPEFLKSLPSHLEYPKLVYPLDGGEPVRVTDADEEAAARAALGLDDASASDDAGTGDEPAGDAPKKRGRKPKA